MATYVSVWIGVYGPEESLQRFHALPENCEILRIAAVETFNAPPSEWAANASASFPELMIIISSNCDEYEWAMLDRYWGGDWTETLEFSFEAQDWECPECGETVDGSDEECPDCAFEDPDGYWRQTFSEAVDEWEGRRLERLCDGWNTCTLADAGLADHPDLIHVGESMKIETDKGLENIWLTLDHTAIQNVDCLSDCANLTSLDLEGCKSLQNVDGLANCTRLTSLNLSSCEALQNMDLLANCTQLTSLDLGYCNALQNVDGLANCTQLTSLDLGYCDALQNLDGLANCTQLTSLDLTGCGKVNPKPHRSRMSTREEVAAYQELIKSSMKE